MCSGRLYLLQAKFDLRLQCNFDLTQVDSQFPLSLGERQRKLKINLGYK